LPYKVTYSQVLGLGHGYFQAGREWRTRGRMLFSPPQWSSLFEQSVISEFKEQSQYFIYLPPSYLSRKKKEKEKDRQ
jgi:hypothetical protein